MKFKNYNDDFKKIKDNAEAKLNEIQIRYNQLINPSEELTTKVQLLETLVERLTIESTLEYHLELKLLVQDIEKILGNGEINPPVDPVEPTVETLILNKDQDVEKILNTHFTNVKDIDKTIINAVYKLFKSTLEFVEEISTIDVTGTHSFKKVDAGSYYCEGTIYYKLSDGGITQEIKLTSNMVEIEDEIKDIPTIEKLELFENNKILNTKLIGVSDVDNAVTKITYELIKNNSTIVGKIEQVDPKLEVSFGTQSEGRYHTKATINYDLNDGLTHSPLIMISNVVEIEDTTIPEDDFPINLPHSNSWAYAKEASGVVTVTLNNTWGIIGNNFAIYKNGIFVKKGIANLTSLNKGSVKNIIKLSDYGINSGDDYKVLYKVTYKRENTEDSVIYYKSTTGVMEISDSGNGPAMCSFPRWDSSMATISAAEPAPNCWHKGKHWTQAYWISAGTEPGTAYNGWTEISVADCPNPSDISVHPIYDPANSKDHLEPMNPNDVISTNEPMEKKHITYLPEWAKWGARAYTPKICPWDKISHAQYAFIDVRPNYSGEFTLDKDYPIAADLAKSVADCKTWDSTKMPKISPNIFDPAAAFSTYGAPGTNPFHGDFETYSKKYPYVVASMSLGGWSRSGFFRDAANDSNREFFVQKCIDLMRILKMQAIDIDWEFPGYKRDGDMGDNRNDMGTPRGGAAEGLLFTLLIRDLRAAMDKAGEEDGKYYFLSCAISAGKTHIDNSDVKNWHQYCDYISYMTYDTHGAFDEYTNHQSYMHQNPNEPLDITNPDENAMSIENVINYVKDKGVPQQKLIIGTPFYSRGWSGIFKETGEEWLIPECPGLYTKSNIIINGEYDLRGRAAPGIMDGGRAAGVMPIRHLNALENGKSVEISIPGVDVNKNPFDGTTVMGNFTKYFDDAAMTPYLFSEKDGILYTYEDSESLSYKSDWIIEEGIGGLISWDISMDDYGYALHGLGEYYPYSSLEVESHQLTNLIFDKFKANKARIRKINR